MDHKFPDLCYALIDVEMMDPSRTHVRPVIIRQGEPGYYPTDWTWSKEHAREALNRANAGLGFTPEQAEEMQTKSIFDTWTTAERNAAFAHPVTPRS